VHLRIAPAWKLAVVASVLFLSMVLTIHAQDIFGTVNGTVTDPSGGLMPAARVTITNEATGVARTMDANDHGFYSFPDLPVGTYTVTVRQTGFKTYKRTGITLNAGFKIAVDVTLDIGATSETVTVVGTGVTLQKDSAEISRVVDTQEIQHAALNERDYMQIPTFVPGFAMSQAGLDQTGLTTSQNLSPGNFNGMRTDADVFTVDGVFNEDGGSNGSQINNVGIDFIQEVNVQTSNYSAEYGRSSAASINVVTRSGGDHYHGNLFWYGRNNAVDASPDNLTGPEPGAAELRFNDFGGDVGGTVPGFLRGKLFFFGGIEAKRLIIPGDGLINLSMPTTAELAGNFCDTSSATSCGSLLNSTGGAASNLLANAGNVSGACIGYYSGGPTDTNAADFVANGTASSPAGTVKGTAISPSCITGAGQAIAKVYKLLETPGATPVSATSFINAAGTTPNATFDLSTPQNWEEDMFRLDYHPTVKHTGYFRFMHDHLLLTDDFGIFGPSHGSALPTSPSLRNRPGYDILFGDIWTPNPHFINEAKFDVAWNKQRIPVTGDAWEESTYGFVNSGPNANYLEPYGNVGPYPTGIPTISYTTCNAGATVGECPAEIYGPYNFLLAPTVDIEPSDAVTVQVRNHTVKFGVDVFRNRKDQNSRDQATQGNVGFSVSDPNSTGDPFADSLMGNYNAYSQYDADPVGHFRFTGYEGYVNDDWRVSRILSLELGVRYEYTVPTYAQGNNMVNFSMADYSPVAGIVVCGPTNEAAGQVCNETAPWDPTGAKLATGTVVNTSANATSILDCPPTPSNQQAGGACAYGGYFIDGLVRTGGNVPAEQAQRVPGAYTPFVLDVPAGGPRGFFKPEGVWGPRVGIAVNPTSKIVVRLGYGIFYDKPEGNLVFSQTSIVPFLQQVNYSFGNLGVLPTTGVSPTQTTIGPSSINPDLRVARVEQYSLSVQYQLPDKIVAQVAYVGNYGWHELREPGINNPSYASALTFAPVGSNSVTTTQAAPLLGFSAMSQYQSDAYSDYNGLQVSAAKTAGLITTQVSYTYSKNLETDSGEGDNPWPMCSFTCVVGGQTVNWQSYFYGDGTGDPDPRNVFVTTFTLNDPLFKSGKGFLGEVAGGWSLSGILRAQSGFPLTVSAGTNVQENDLVSGTLVACPPTGSSAACLSGTETNRANLEAGQAISPGFYNNTGVNGCISSTTVNGTASKPTTGSQVSADCYFNTSAFTDAGMTTAVGTAPLGDIIGPGLLSMDVSLRKNFALPKEGMGLLLQMDCFDVLNHPNLGNPNTTVTSSSFGEITGLAASAPRQFQLGLRFTF